MQITRRLMLALAAALALAPSRAKAAPAFALDVIRNRFSLKLPDSESGVPTGLAARPGGALLVHSAESPLFGRAFGLGGDPAGGRFKIVSDDVDGTSVSGAYPDPVAFGDGSALIVFCGTVRGVDGFGVFVRPLAADGRKGDFVRVGGTRERPVAVAAARLGEDAAIVVWGAQSVVVGEKPKLRWRIVGADGGLRGEVRTLDAPDGVGLQFPRTLAGLTGGGAAIGFVRAENSGEEGDLWTQRVSAEGDAVGEPVRLGPEQPFALAGLGRNRLAACVGNVDGDIDLTVFSAAGRPKPPVAVRTGLTSILGMVAARPILPDDAAQGLAILLAGFEARRMVVSLLLVDARGAPLAKPARIFRGADGPGVFGRRSEARHLAVLENGDLLAVYRLKDGALDPTPPVASIIRIG